MDTLDTDREILKKLTNLFKDLVDLTDDFSLVCIKGIETEDNATRLIKAIQEDLNIVDDEIRKLVIAYKMTRMTFEQLEKLDDAAEKILNDR